MTKRRFFLFALVSGVALIVAAALVTACFTSVTDCSADYACAPMPDDDAAGDVRDSGDAARDAADAADSGDSIDSGDAGNSDDAGDSGDSGDSNDAGDSGDSGDSSGSSEEVSP